ncbi:hypothetical protein C1646_728455 [Rhizophagus diaphanus]|nr:hypothetical protein C1646_728455 [Rhizophagus diaphanus] [Rhizophagus sp. MUCL 43196]
MTKKRQQKRKTVDESEYTPKETTQKDSKKQKTEEEISQSSIRRSERVARQVSDLSRVAGNLRIDSDSDYGLKDLPSRASKFTEEDIGAFNATFVPASDGDDLIPEVEVTNLPDQYDLPHIGRDVLERKKFDVRDLKDADGEDTDGYVKQFYKSLHRIVMNAGVEIGTDESKTDSLVNHLLTRACGFDEWPFGVRIKERYKLIISDRNVSANPDFVVDMEEVAIIVTEDKHMQNVSPPAYGEPQLLAEILACGSANLRLARKMIDQTIYAIRVISTYVTFYKVEISKEYWRELGRGLPQQQSIEILRWPGENDLESGLDLADPGERVQIFEAITRIRQSLVQSTTTTTSATAPVEQSNKSEGKKPL